MYLVAEVIPVVLGVFLRTFLEVEVPVAHPRDYVEMTCESPSP
jgi:hypothetical protein